MFSSSFEFTDLLYDLPGDEDFALIQDITFRNNITQTKMNEVPMSIPNLILTKNYFKQVFYGD